MNTRKPPMETRLAALEVAMTTMANEVSGIKIEKANLERAIAQLGKDISDMQTRSVTEAAAAHETFELVKLMHDAWMRPQPGHERPLIDRMAAVTIEVESGKTVARWVLGFIGAAATLAALVAALRAWPNGD